MGNVLSVMTLVATVAARNAPADQYFGKLEMSSLRIRYEAMQLRKRYETHQLLPEQAKHLLDLTDDAFNRWAAAYPRDAWLASTGFIIAALYDELPGSAARDRSVALFVFVKSHFPTTSYAAQSRELLHRGIALKPEPAWAASMRAATSPPSPAQSPTPTPTIVPSSKPSEVPL
jgi:hypothetical protein